LGTDRGADLDENPEGAVYCARHPNVETYLRCGRCDTPICPRCLIQTPVGARCRECANLTRLPTFNVTPAYFARGMTAAIFAGAIVGVVWAAISDGRSQVGLFTVVIGLGVGWLLSEAVSLSANRKRGLGLQICAVLGVALAYMVLMNISPYGISFSIPLRFQGDLIAAIIAAIFAGSRLKGF
jgi:hypothetical protein